MPLPEPLAVPEGSELATLSLLIPLGISASVGVGSERECASDWLNPLLDAAAPEDAGWL